MDKLREYNCIIYLSTSDSEEERMLNMGIQVEDETPEEKIVKYSFDVSNIIEVRETFLKYKEDWQNAIVATYEINGNVLVTPPLLISYEGFKKSVNEYNKENTQA